MISFYEVFVIFFTLLIGTSFTEVASVIQGINCPVQSLYQLGDSISDTGNVAQVFPFIAAAGDPYGMTFPGNPNGRWSDGRLIIDYIATALGLPPLSPFVERNASNFENGVNFAVAGSTAEDFLFYLKKGIITAPLPSLSFQFTLLTNYLNSRYSTTTERAEKLKKSVVFVGESGYNDFGFSIYEGRSPMKVYTYVPSIVQTIINTARGVINLGATQIVVPGNFPLGCFPWALLAEGSSDPTSYDELGCLKSINNLTSSLNQQLQQDLDSLRNEFPNVVILYADYYNAFLTLLQQPSNFGFDRTVALKPCCGSGTYNFFSPNFCGNLVYSVCPDPNVYIHWDGVHLTQEAHRRISQILINDLNITCTLNNAK